jgi:hypothetical protein
MCKAVGNAVASGATVPSIIAQSATMKEADQKTLLTALYAAGASDDAIRVSAEKTKISDLTLIDAFNASNKQGCIDDHSVAQHTATPTASPTVVATAASVDPAQAAQKAALAAGETASVAPAASPVAAVATTAAAAPSPAARKATPVTDGAPATTAAEPASWTVDAGSRPARLGDYWDTFYKNYKTMGIDKATILALTEGVQPAALIEAGLALENLNPQNLIKAMYCAGYNGDDIKKACDQYGISELVLVSGFKKSRAECSQDCRDPDGDDTQAYTPADPEADTQPYTPAAGPAMAGVPSPSSGGLSYAPAYASPSHF